MNSPVAYLSWAAFGKKGMAALAATEKAVREQAAPKQDGEASEAAKGTVPSAS